MAWGRRSSDSYNMYEPLPSACQHWLEIEISIAIAANADFYPADKIPRHPAFLSVARSL